MSEAKRSSRTAPVSRRNPATLLDATEIGNSQISIAESGRLAFVAGQTASPVAEGESVPADLAGQAKVVAGHLTAVLDELGASARDVVAFRMFVVNATTDRFQEAWTALRVAFSEEMPSGTAIGV